MKLIIAGSTGFVATEVIRQALSHPLITSVVALARRPTTMPQGVELEADAAKFNSIVCDDFLNYPESVRRELAGADACIWLIAVTISRAKLVSAEEARRICLDYTMIGLDTMFQLSSHGTASNTFRFLYVSGAKSERDPSKKPWILGDYLLMRGEVESRVLEYAQDSGGAVGACVLKPGLINEGDRTGLVVKVAQEIGRSIVQLPKVGVDEIAAALLYQAINGLDKDTLLNQDIVTIGQKVLANR